MEPKVIFSSGHEVECSKIIGVGRNYKKHIDEMKSQLPETPVLFLKPNTALLPPGNPIDLPDFSREIHHEIELAVCIGRTGKNIPAAQWNEYVMGYGIALDLTLRDLQSEAKKKGLPWAVAKGFDGSCPVSYFVEAERIENPQNLTMRLFVNNQLRQEGNTSEMIFPIADLIARISEIFTLKRGDLILTGTPAGVGALRSGDQIIAEIDQIGRVEFRVA